MKASYFYYVNIQTSRNKFLNRDGTDYSENSLFIEYGVSATGVSIVSAV